MSKDTAVPIRDAIAKARVDTMTDEDIARAVGGDPDASPLISEEQLAAGRVVWPIDVAATRRRLGLSQTELAACFGISPGALRDWDQGRRVG